MTFEKRHLLFDQFLNRWQERIVDFQNFYKYFATPDATNKNLGNLFSLEYFDLYNSQSAWISLVHQIEHPLDKEFFKEYWIPVQAEAYDYFIDLSDYRLPLFKIR